jgi:hypothetical protein
MPSIFEKLQTGWRTHSLFAWIVVKQLAIPAAVAAAYGIYDWHSSKGSFSFSAYLKVTLPALFFIMWFVGLYERARKKTADKESFDNLSTGLNSLTDLVKDLRKSPHATTGAATPTPLEPSYSGSLVTEAFTIFAAGHKLAALLQAGVAFEQAVRAFARRQGVENADHMPLLRILQKIDFLLPQGWQGELHMLRQIRNQLTHASEQELDRIEQPEVVLNTYALAIKALTDENTSRRLVHP